jgi:hypothetical protein
MRIRGTLSPGTYRMRITGVDVEAGDENPACDTGERLLYFAYRWR